jgi:hypothetical protein
MFKKLAKKGASMIEGVIALTIFIIVVAAVLIPQIVATNTTTWGTGSATLWSTLTIVVVAGVMLVVYRTTSGGA